VFDRVYIEHYSLTQKISKEDTGKEEDVWASQTS
jgi:hypothetical protein